MIIAHLSTSVPTHSPAWTGADVAAAFQSGQLALAINAEHAACQQALQNGLAAALHAGELLLQAKAHCEHGEWLPWLREHFDGSERTAQAYMRVARERPTLEDGNPQHAADLSLRAALAALAGPADPPAPQPPMSPIELASAGLPAIEERASTSRKHMLELNTKLMQTREIAEIVAIVREAEAEERFWRVCGAQIQWLMTELEGRRAELEGRRP